MHRMVAVFPIALVMAVATVAPAMAGPLGPGWHVTAVDPTQAPLFAVSCASDRSCLGVGINSGEVWNGEAWTATSAAPPAYDVSCPAVRDCMVAGIVLVSPGDPRDSYEHPAIWHWNGRTYSPMSLPIDPVAEGRASAVSCPASDACMVATGRMMLHWDGSSWMQTTLPATAAGPMWSYDVDCAQPSHCVAVGVDPANNAAAAVWDGSTWTAMTAPPFDPAQVACEGTDFCMAVGSSSFDGGNFGDIDSTASWDGSTWTPVTLPDLGLTFEYNILSCSAPDNCMITLGDREHWDGRTWTLTAGPSLSDGRVEAVDCPDATTCLAVGYQAPVDVAVAYAERWKASTITG